MAVSRENPETLCLYPVQVDTAHLSPEAPKNNGIFGSSCSVNRTAVKRRVDPQRILPEAAWVLGYLTATSYATGKSMRGLGGSGIDHWLDNFLCAHALAQNSP